MTSPERTSVDFALVDEIVHQRPRRRRATPAERAEAIRQLRRGGVSTYQIEETYGMNWLDVARAEELEPQIEWAFPDLPGAECAKAADSNPATAELFFASDRDPGATSQAQAICRRCPTIRACLAWALTHDEAGVWAGTTETQRQQLRDQHRRNR